MLFVGISLTSAFSKEPRPIEISVLDDELRCCRLVQSAWCEPTRLIAREPEVVWDVLTAEIPESDFEEVVWAIDGPQGLASVEMNVR